MAEAPDGSRAQHAHCPLGQFCTSLRVCGDCSGCNYNQVSITFLHRFFSNRVGSFFKTLPRGTHHHHAHSRKLFRGRMSRAPPECVLLSNTLSSCRILLPWDKRVWGLGFGVWGLGILLPWNKSNVRTHCDAPYFSPWPARRIPGLVRFDLPGGSMPRHAITGDHRRYPSEVM